MMGIIQQMMRAMSVYFMGKKIQLIFLVKQPLNKKNQIFTLIKTILLIGLMEKNLIISGRIQCWRICLNQILSAYLKILRKLCMKDLFSYLPIHAQISISFVSGKIFRKKKE